MLFLLFCLNCLQVLSFNQLFNDYKDQDTFIACGTEPLIKSTQLSSDSASEDMSPRVVDHRARERVKFAVPQNPKDDRATNGYGGKWRARKNQKHDGRNGHVTQAGISVNVIFETLVKVVLSSNN